MSGEPIDEPTAAFTPTWDPVWEDEPRRPQPVSSPAPVPSPPLSALLPIAALPAPERDPERAVRPSEGRRNENGRGRARLVLARFRALITLFVLVVISGFALAAAIGLAAIAFGVALRQLAGT